MLQASTIQFLKDLKKNNHKEWFDVNRKKYEEAKADFEKFIAEVLALVSQFDGTVAELSPKDCTYRINRDIRFSKDKTPYKNHFALYISKGGKKSTNAGYYFHLEPGGVFIAGGVWMPMAPELKKIRQEIDYNWEAFEQILHHKKFKQTFGNLSQDEILSRPPKGYEEDNPAIEFIKLKSFLAITPINDTDITSKDFAKKLASYFELLQPLVQFMNEAVEA